LQLDQNSFSTKSRGGKTTPVSGGRFGNIGFEGGYQIESVMVDGKAANYVVEDWESGKLCGGRYADANSFDSTHG